MDLVETYIRDLLDIHRSGQAVKETSYYGALANLLYAAPHHRHRLARTRARC